MLQKTVAFTLAEILITLGIIGIVSAMTIPTLITKHQKKVIESRITQDFSIIQQVLRMHVVDGLDLSSESIPDGNTTVLKEWYAKYWAPYLKTSKICYDSAGCWHSDGVTKSLSGDTAYNSSVGIGVGGNIVIVRLPNGSSICIDAWRNTHTYFPYVGVNSAYTIVTLYVDANGDSKPNVFGKDIYVFVWARETGLVPAGYNKTLDEVKTNCSSKSTGKWAGFYCLQRIKSESWKILDEVWDR